jgi:hypothetical protein
LRLLRNLKNWLIVIVQYVAEYPRVWGHIDSQAFTKTGKGKTISYMHGDRTLSIHTCCNCGCTTHWENQQSELGHMAVNFRMCDPKVFAEYRIRRFDGADSWEFID